MHIILQHSNPEHRVHIAGHLQAMDDSVLLADDLAEAASLLARHAGAGLVLEYSDEAYAFASGITERSPATRVVFLADRPQLPELSAAHPDANIAPLPGTTIAIRFLLSPDPANDPACQLGDFHLQDLVALGSRTHIFKALQASIHRPVRLRLLNTEYEKDDQAVAAFLNTARAKAAVNHDRIGSVYQALESDGSYFYAAEEIEGDDLVHHARSHAPYPAEFAIDVLRTTASALHTLEHLGLMATRLEPRHIHISGHRGTPRIDNPAAPGPAPAGHHGAILQHLAAFFLEHANALTPAEIALRAKLGEIIASPPEEIDAGRIASSLRTLQTTRVNLSHEREESEPQNKWIRPLVAGVAAIALVFLVFFYGSGKGGGGNSPEVRAIPNLGASVVVPGGRFDHPLRGPLSVEPYSVDLYEVTIREYARFLEHIADRGDSNVRHPSQPSTKTSYEPADWDTYYAAAKNNTRYLDAALTLDCPVFNVDYWDARAYARWQNRRLPTEEEWEVASRRDGDWSRFPWGPEADPTLANTRDKPAPIRGFRLWCPVDMPGSDRTLYGVLNLGGNVSEWTSSETVHPDFPDRMIPIVKGGSFAVNAADSETFNRRKVLSPGERHPWLGFRTVGHAPSAPDPPNGNPQ